MEYTNASTINNLDAFRRRPTPELIDDSMFGEANRYLSEKEAFNIPLHLDNLPFDVNPLSPTPLDVDRLQVYGQYAKYNEAAVTYMTGLAYEASKEAGLSPAYAEVLLNEIITQHNLRCLENVKAFSRIKYRNPEDGPQGCLDKGDAEMISRVRAAIGFEHEPALLLGIHPEMGGIETMKDTDPMRGDRLMLADMTYMGSLARRAISSKSIQNFEVIPEDDPRSKVHLLDTPLPILVKKMIQATMSVGEVPIQLVTRNSFLVVPDSEIKNPLGAVRHVGKDGKVYYVLGVDITKYVRIDPTSELYKSQLQQQQADTSAIPIWSKEAFNMVQRAARRHDESQLN